MICAQEKWQPFVRRDCITVHQAPNGSLCRQKEKKATRNIKCGERNHKSKCSFSAQTVFLQIEEWNWYRSDSSAERWQGQTLGSRKKQQLKNSCTAFGFIKKMWRMRLAFSLNFHVIYQNTQWSRWGKNTGSCCESKCCDINSDIIAMQVLLKHVCNFTLNYKKMFFFGNI